MRVTLRDVADDVGVSVATVSRVLTGKSSGRVRPEVAADIRQAAARMGYRSNALARGLRLQETRILGFISDVIATGARGGQILLGAQDAARRYGYTLLTVNTGDDPDVEAHHLDALASYRVDGYLYASMFNRPLALPSRLETLPTVIVDATSPTQSTPSVSPDEKAIGRLGARELLRAGARRILYVSTPAPIVARAARLDGFFAEIRGTTADVEVRVLEIAESISHARGPLVEALKSDVDGVFCFNDLRAAMVYQASTAAERVIGHDLAVISVDRTEMLQQVLYPNLSSIALPHYQMGYWGCTKLITSLLGNSLDLDDPSLTDLPACALSHALLAPGEPVDGASCILTK
ncbi:LacI family DNA-binding transcriptional regulator [Nanchangia anserum]|uniref:LacI family DNA-binding transcriptional regulator n=1 Tax=Nanchangia anserum TaxID=2692125 RepID=A0A8I0KN88_9ACTO|nr:LacI family DNA-binding transcriptional regulator [Nanchangia anserum]MBD3689016.1 LacI family DNA-binding transcriptional regulator [Nanchangia anserum]QOX81262.1 LacI family DNA-binding transcriptional regulator [Nanchangia anserum]